MDKSGATSSDDGAHENAAVSEVKEKDAFVVDYDSDGGDFHDVKESTTTTEIPKLKSSSQSASLLVKSSTITDHNNHLSKATNDSVTKPSSSTSSLRSVVGKASIEISNLMNDNLIAARYVVLFSVSTLGIYALTQTPLFFRYRNVADIPSHYFYRRKTITGRLMIRHHRPQAQKNATGSTSFQNRSVAQPSDPTDETSITCYIRHLSPVETLLSKKWLHRYWDLGQKLSTNSSILSSSEHAKPEESISELIKVQIAGIQYPHRSIKGNSSNKFRDVSPRTGNGYNLVNDIDWNGAIRMNHGTTSYGSDWIQRLSQKQCIVRCQFIGRQVPNYEDTNATKQYIKNKRPIPGMTETTTNMIDATVPLEDRLEHQVAIVKLYYHPPLLHPPNTTNTNDDDDRLYQRLQNLFRRRLDLGVSMIQQGYAIVSENGLYSTTSTSTTATRIIDTTASSTIPTNGPTTSFAIKNNTQQVQQDLRYIDQLTRAEYQAAQTYAGIWKDPSYRQERSDVMDEIHFQQHSTILQKMFRWIRGG